MIRLYQVNRYVALEETTALVRGHCRGKPIDFPSDWDFYDTLDRNEITYRFICINLNELSVAKVKRLKYSVSKMNKNIENTEIENLIGVLPQIK